MYNIFMCKKILFVFLSFLLIVLYLLYDKETYHKVLDISSPVDVFVDVNKNFIFDEKTPVHISEIYYINAYQNYDKSVFQKLTFEQKFFLEYQARNYSFQLLKNKFIKLKNDDLIVDKKSYKSLLLNSGLFFDNTKETQEKVINYISKINIDDYYIYNIKSKKYHKLNCPKGIKSKKYLILHKSNLKKYTSKCKYCLPEENLTEKYPPEQLSYNNKSLIKKTIDNKYENRILKNSDIVTNKGFLKVLFIELNSTLKPDSRCNTEACKELLGQINNTKDTIDFAIYGFDNQPEIFKALINAKKRGVKIRWISNYENSSKKYYPDIEKLKLNFTDYKTNNIPDKKNSSGIMHNKFFIFDNEIVYTGSSNITSTDLSGFNANYVIIIKSKEAAGIFLEEFNQMYSGNFGVNKRIVSKNILNLNKNTKITILFSPKDLIIDNYIIKIINKSEKYIYIPVFFITHKGILNSLINAKERGVDVKVINDATNAHSKYTIHKKLRNAGIKVKTENYAGKMHMKAIFTDDKYSIIGSMNLTLSGNKKNDENVIIIENEEITKQLKKTFLYLWNKIPDKYEKRDPHAESIESIGSCFDGIDNDFDDKIDEKDEGCFTP